MNAQRIRRSQLLGTKTNQNLFGTARKISLLCLAILFGCVSPTNLYSQNSTDQKSQTTKDFDDYLSIQKRVANVIEASSKSVVSIARVGKNDLEDPISPTFVPKEFGTGVAIDSNGLILTCYHVLGDPSQNDYYVWIAGTPFKVREVEKAKGVIAADPWTDLAILKIDAKLTPIKLATDARPFRGQFVISLGNPYGIARDGNASASFGIIANLLRQRSIKSASELDSDNSDTFSQYGTLIQSDIKLNRGTSGGPLLNLDGEMIGLTSALAPADQYDAAAGFSIPVDTTFLRTIEKLKKGRSADFGFLGIATRELSLAQRQQFKKGVIVTQVVDNTPADISGLKFGDVITHVEGKEIISSSSLLKELSGRFADDEIAVSVQRQPFPNSRLKKLELKVRLGKKKVNSRQPTIGVNDVSAWRGLKVDYPTAINDLPFHVKKIDTDGCVVITSVEKDSFAAKAGLKENMFISHVGNQRVSTPADFHSNVSKASGEVEIRITTNDIDQKQTTVVGEK